jgi:phospholipid/cholesterol/gamma-HCH transport system substrate-binding protein
VNSKRAVGAGAFLVIGMLLFTAALFMIGERRMLFASRFPVYAEFSKLGQLEVGAIVRVAGAEAGEVTDIQVPSGPSGKFRVKMEVRDDLHPLIRTDSVAMTQTEGLVGAIFVNIQAGTEQSPPIPEGGTIHTKDPFTMADLMQQMSDTVATIDTTVQAISGDLETAIQQVSLTANDAHALLLELKPEIQAIAHNGARISADAQQVVANIREGRGTIGKLINDDTLYQRVREITDQTQAVMTNVRDVTTEARRAISDFRSKDGPAQGLLADVRVTLNQAREATADLADNMEAMKHNFLLRGFFNRRGYFDLDSISPADYRTGVLENGKRKAMRIWLNAAVLFELGPDGIEELSAAGHARLDSAMATFLQYVPANPVVVEGYATTGTIDERFRLARQRAGTVREYVLSRYSLAPQSTGFIALGADAKDSPAGERWDGIALTLFLDREELQFGPQQVAR